VYDAWGHWVWGRDFGIETMGGSEIKWGGCVIKGWKINSPHRQKRIFLYTADGNAMKI
jgi:hypothetical protein